ncbi:cadherin domain-containing protein [Microvirga sp. BT689]|uniref:cadherin domain-containing protein n=1 Tax=Microvirga arvi TaxID=2778731 RepID=UPI001950D192|nr:cadherin domain-containing protein [Microvirga arvi]MBM6582066.1 cadherin domain-containing protein [Microvirga arvi]
MPIVITAKTVQENLLQDTVVGVLDVDNPPQGTGDYTFALEEDFGGRFKIEQNATSGDWELIAIAGANFFNFEDDALSSFPVAITATRGDHSTLDATITVEVTDIDEAPTDIVVTGGTVAESTAVGTVVASLKATDPDAADQNATFTYTLVDAQGNATTSNFFTVDGAAIKLKAGLDNAQVGTHTLYVKVADPQDASLSYVEQVTITVTNSAETATGTNKNDRIIGTADDDILNGLGGNDKIYGLGGNDTINGGLGKDMLYGGDGQDTFVFDTAVKKGHFDHIEDFKASDDTIQISLAALKAFKVKGPKTSDVHSKKGADDDKGKPDDKGGTKSVGFDKLFVKGQKLQKKFFNVGTKLSDTPDGSNDYIFYNKKNGFVYLDLDGSGKGKGIEILKVKPGTALTADDFLFI